MWFEIWRKNATISEFDDLQEHSDNHLKKILMAAVRSGDDHRLSAVMGILMNRRGLERDKDK